MKKISLILLSLVLFASCNQLDRKIQGGWVIDQAYYYDEPVIWDLYSNGLEFHKDKTCVLPISNYKHRHTDREIGKWKIFNKKDNIYLEINTENEIFNRIFEIHNLRKVQDTVSWGYLLKMTLIADSLKLDCTKALYE